MQLLDAGADVSAADSDVTMFVCLQVNECVDGKLPLHVAAVKGHNDIMRTLLDAGADVSAADSNVTMLYVYR